ncbi:MAG: calcium-binding protein, partial [Sciscionella sp.]
MTDDAPRRSPVQELDDLISEIVVDCYDEDECMMAFCTVLEDEIPLPFEIVFLGMPVEVIAIGAGLAPVVVATCRRGTETGDVDLTSLTFPDGSVAAWLQAAYLRYLGHDPGRPSPP